MKNLLSSRSSSIFFVKWITIFILLITLQFAILRFAEIFDLKYELYVVAFSSILSGGILAVLGQIALSDWQVTHLVLNIKRDPSCEAPSFVKTQQGAEHSAFWLRGIIQNKGRHTARSAQIFIERVGLISDKDGMINSADWKDTLPLEWSIRGGKTELDLVPEVEYTFDVCRAINYGGLMEFRLCTPEFPNRYEPIFSRSGEYTLDLVITAINCKPRRETVRFRWGRTLTSLKWAGEFGSK